MVQLGLLRDLFIRDLLGWSVVGVGCRVKWSVWVVVFSGRRRWGSFSLPLRGGHRWSGLHQFSLFVRFAAITVADVGSVQLLQSRAIVDGSVLAVTGRCCRQKPVGGWLRSGCWWLLEVG
ncbi:UNVERIFIED_CONTAM: hypothetical protein Sangu_0178700 [Sesamum angustifolium]|uniref:Secreted protein n=1 Tax=Sesamum angustifolium TaxID=2727405 RepID=A0AAW2RM39_9LAMI